MNKFNKGQMHNVLTLILILASAVAIFLVLTSFKEASTLEEAINACKISVVAQSSTDFGLISESSPLDINCDKRYVDFYNTRVELGLSLENMETIPVVYGKSEVKKFNELNENIVYQVISEELSVCKRQFGDGRIKIFVNKEDSSGALQKNTCFVCSEIKFKPGVKKQIFTDLKNYTQKNKIPDKEYTYYNYLTEPTISGNPMWPQPVEEGIEGDINIDSSKTYLVFAERADPGKLDLLNWKDGIYLLIVPQEEIETYCAQQAS